MTDIPDRRLAEELAARLFWIESWFSGLTVSAAMHDCTSYEDAADIIESVIRDLREDQVNL